MASRAAFFQQVKPVSVRISQLAIKQSGNPVVAGELVQLLQDLLSILNTQIGTIQSPFDEKIADYVFFPISHVLRGLDRHHMDLVEALLRCLEVLVVHGWKSKIAPAIVFQLLSLLLFVLDGKPRDSGDDMKAREITEETSIAAFDVITGLLRTSRTSNCGSDALFDKDGMPLPVLAHALNIALDQSVDGRSPGVQLAALSASEACLRVIRNHAGLVTFLPGTVSSLVKLLSLPLHHRRRVLVAALDCLRLALTETLGDLRVTRLSTSVPVQASLDITASQQITPGWLSATASQVKLALETVIRLRNHGSEDIRRAIYLLCITLLDQCHTSLTNCAALLVETAIILTPERAEDVGFGSETELEDLVGLYPEMADHVKSAVFSWLNILPGVMRSGDELSKSQAVSNITKALRLVSSLHIDSATLSDSVASALRESVAALLTCSTSAIVIQELPHDTVVLVSTAIPASEQLTATKFSPLMLQHESESGIRMELDGLLRNIGSSERRTRLAADMLERVQEASGVGQISSFWLAYRLLKTVAEEASQLSNLLDLSPFKARAAFNVVGKLGKRNSPMDNWGKQGRASFDALVSLSMVVIDAHSDIAVSDWRLEATAMEVLTFAASQMGTAFRPELIDVLYPTIMFLGSANEQLRSHAITSLKSIASSCDYENVSSMIIDNVDYMINSVALRLDTLDVPPASMQVLTMMVRLAGPRLVPFLDDVIKSIFAALENHHGYPSFVNSLFGVLVEVVNQGVKSDLLLTDGHTLLDKRKWPPDPKTLDNVIEALHMRIKYWTELDASRRILHDAEGDASFERHPKKPWKTEEPEKVPKLWESDNTQPDQIDDAMKEEKKPKVPTYDLLLKIAYLTQHYLTAPTPKLRKNLLDLLRIAIPALCPDDDSFLPLVHAVWPVMITRLYDPEPFVTVAACEAIVALCVGAGDFLGSRMRTEWENGRLVTWLHSVKDRASRNSSIQRDRRSQRGSTALTTGRTLQVSNLAVAVNKPQHQPVTGGLGQFAQDARIWEAVVHLLRAIVLHVRVDEVIFDDIVDLLADRVAEGDQESREALCTVSEDAVWLTMYERGTIAWRPTPMYAGIRFPAMRRP